LASNSPKNIEVKQTYCLKIKNKKLIL